MMIKVTKKQPVYVLRTCGADMSSYGGFIWPNSGPVAAPDWRADDRCGGGLHGFLWGEGNGELASWESDALWLVVRITSPGYVDLDGKVKFEAGEVVFCGDRAAAVADIAARGAIGAIVGGLITRGDNDVAQAGYRGTATAGEGGTATAGYRGTATAGYRGTATAGYRGTATAGEGGTLVIRWYDSTARRYRIAEGYVGESGILPGVPYRVENGNLVAVQS